jgi:CheY-like chemotaxis protein
LPIPANLRAVVADDSDVARHHIGQILTGLGIEVAAYAEDGVRAVQRCLTLRPDLLVSDLVMPGLTGVDVVRIIRTRLPTQVVIVTSHCDRSLHTRCLALGASDVLIKPISAEELQHVLGPLFR